MSSAIPAAPDWLAARLGAAVPRAETDQRPVPDASPDAVARAKEWLSAQPPAVEGQGGDLHTYKAACGLRDRGLSRGQALDLLAEWNEKCQPPWAPQDLETKIGNAYRYAENEPGARAIRPEDFPRIVQFPVEALSDDDDAPKTLNDWATDETRNCGYVIKHFLQRGTYAEIFGAPGVGKSFVALDIAYHVAAGLPWMGRRVRQGLVLYLAYEGEGGLKNRAKALRQVYGTAPVPLYMKGASFNLREKSGREALGKYMHRLPENPALIVIDTFARALMGGDENSAQDVGAFNAGIAALIESTGACVLILHHSGKDKSRGARGSSALLGALDTEVEIDSGAITSRKQREGELGQPIGFKLMPIVVGMDEDDEPEHSCVVLPAVVDSRKGEAAADDDARRVLDHLQATAGQGFYSVTELEGESATLGLGQKRIRDAVRRLRARGKIEDADLPDGLGLRKGGRKTYLRPVPEPVAELDTSVQTAEQITGGAT